jgi:metal-responsive CopG/Arc/MetJ family transcriptional regulator
MPDTDTREIVKVRLSDDELAQFDAIAQAHGLTTRSAAIRFAGKYLYNMLSDDQKKIERKRKKGT